MNNEFDPFNRQTLPQNTPPLSISPIFGLIVLVTLVAGYLTYTEMIDPRLPVFLFVTGGWIISLCLHEFGHALTAYWGGDKSVVNQGYLTLNPLKYTHGFLSIVLPLIFLAMGGIGLPGGAVYIHMEAIRSRGMRSLVSAAGPIATAICAFILLLPFAFGFANPFSHLSFWSAVALLAFLQITALLFNLLPIPGLDGFGILAPYLPAQLLTTINRFGSLTFFIIFFLFFNPTPISRAFWQGIRVISELAGLDFSLVGAGLSLYQFWQF